MDEQATLELLATAKDQDELERDIGRQADHLLTEQADERDSKRLEKTEAQRQRLHSQLKKVDQRLGVPGGSRTTTLLLNEKQKLETDIKTAELEIEQIKARIAERRQDLDEAEQSRQDGGGGEGQRPGESRRDFLIRTGKITPFSKIPQAARMSSNLADIMLEAEAQDEEEPDAEAELEATAGPRSHQVLRRPGFADDETPATSSAGEATPQRTAKKRKLRTKRERVLRGSASEASEVLEAKH